MTNPQTLGSALRATCTATRELVRALHTGEIPSALVANRSRSVCWTPSFQPGRAPESPDSKPYSALLISLMLGNATSTRRPHDIVKLALLILELHEMGPMDDSDLEDIFNGTDGFTKKLLQEVLTKTREAHYIEEAESILSEA